jgi:hypothetical protein
MTSPNGPGVGVKARTATVVPAGTLLPSGALSRSVLHVEQRLYSIDVCWFPICTISPLVAKPLASCNSSVAEPAGASFATMPCPAPAGTVAVGGGVTTFKVGVTVGVAVVGSGVTDPGVGVGTVGVRVLVGFGVPVTGVREAVRVGVGAASTP